MLPIKNIKVILASMTPWGTIDNPNQEKVITINKWIKNYCIIKDLIHLDYFSGLSEDKRGFKPEYTFDGVHPTREGYQVMGKLAESAIQEALQLVPARPLVQTTAIDASKPTNKPQSTDVNKPTDSPKPSIEPVEVFFPDRPKSSNDPEKAPVPEAGSKPVEEPKDAKSRIRKWLEFSLTWELTPVLFDGYDVIPF